MSWQNDLERQANPTINFDGFPLGMDNRSNETSLPKGAVRRIVNMDVVAQGNLDSRSGYTRVVSGGAHSLWSDGDTAYFVQSGTLYRMGSDYAPSVVLAGFSGAPVSYEALNGEVYLSDGHQSAKIDLFGRVRSWGVETPAGPPKLTAQTAGGLNAGTYLVTLTYLTATGEESGAPEANGIAVVQGGGIYLENIPQPATSDVTKIRVYLSTPNGDAMYYNQDLSVGATAAFVSPDAPGKMLKTQFAEPMPAGTIVRYFNGRLLVASGGTLWYSHAYNYGLTKRSTNFVAFPHDITMMEPVGTSGVFVSTSERTFFISGSDIAQAPLVRAHQLPAIPRSGLREDAANLGIEGASGQCVVWMTTSGWMLGTEGGQVRPLTADRLALPAYESGATVFRNNNGVKQLLSFMKGGESSGGAVSDSITGEIIRNGVLVE